MRVPFAVALVAVALGAAPALADIPPPSTYVETCTIADQQTTTSECIGCSAYYGDVNRCTKMLAPYCYTKVCKAYGASFWTEVLCRTKDEDAPVVPSDIISILASASTAGPANPADGGMPKTCAPYVPSTGTTTTTSTATATQSSTETKTPTDVKTSTATQSSTETKTPTDVKTSTATQSSTETETPTDVKTSTDTHSASDTQTAISTQPGTSSQSGTNTQSTTLSQTGTGPTSTGTQTASGPATATKPSEDSSGCSVTTRKSAVRALGPLTVILAGLALIALRRRSRR